MPVAFTAAQIAEMAAKMKNLTPASPTKTGLESAPTTVSLTFAASE